MLSFMPALDFVGTSLFATKLASTCGSDIYVTHDGFRRSLLGMYVLRSNYPKGEG